MKKLLWVMLVLIFTGMALGGTASADEKFARVLNASEPGMPFDISTHAVEGKTTIFDFYSKYCGPCVRIAPKLEELDRKRDDVVVFKLNINRKGISGIDWKSPLVAQYKLRSVPTFFIYNPQKKVTHSGPQATRKVVELLKESGIEF